MSDDLLEALYREATIVRGKGEAFAAMRAALETDALVSLPDVLRIWHGWRKSLSCDDNKGFTHSDGTRFVQALDDLLAKEPSR